MSLNLAEIVAKYLDAARGYGKPIPMSSLGLSQRQIEEAFSAFDEDYHISRFFQFSRVSGTEYQIDGFPQTHVAIDADIQSIL